MKTYLKLEGKPGTQLCTSTYLLDKNPLLWKTPVPNKAEKKKRAKAPIKRRFKVRLIEQSLPINPTPTVVTTTAASTQMLAVKPTATTANPTPLPVTIYNLAQSRIQEIPNPSIRKFKGEEGPSTHNSDNPSKVLHPKATTTATAPQTREDIPWPNTMPVFTNLFVARASWPIPPSETSTPIFIKTEKAEERTPPKTAAILHVMVNKPPQKSRGNVWMGTALPCLCKIHSKP